MTRPRRSANAGIRHVLVLDVAAERAEAWMAAGAAAWGAPGVQIERPGGGPACWLEFYFEDEVRARLAAAAVRGRQGVRGALVRTLRPRDWTAFWRGHFRPHAVGRRLWICPVWRRRARVPRGRLALLVDPGLSFGTGDHFTTRFCLEMLDRFCDKSARASCWDAGTGSGILAIAAARLGCRRVVGTDSDPQALAQARRNVALNRAGGRVKLREADVRDRAPGRFDFVVANLYAGLLEASAAILAGATRRRLIVSGVRESEADAVADAFAARGLREVVRDGDGEWTGMVFER